MANITTNTLKIGDNNLVLRDADAQAKLATNTQKIEALEEDTSTLKDDLLQLAERVGDIEVAVSLLDPGYLPTPPPPGMEE